MKTVCTCHARDGITTGTPGVRPRTCKNEGCVALQPLCPAIYLKRGQLSNLQGPGTRTIPGEGVSMFGIVLSRIRVGAAALVFILLSAAAAAAAPAGHVDWLKPSDGPYPVLHPGDPISIHVSISRQRVYIMRGKRVIYTMTASTGLENPKDDATPQGVFYIQRERGLSFYAPSEHEGARYWVSWLHHGEYLFHSVPVNRNGKIIRSEAEKLGREASHGCVRLTVPDARWFYRHIPYHTKVVIGQ